MSSWMQMMLQDAASSTMIMLTSLHNLIIMIMMIVMTTISYMMLFIIMNKFTNRTLKKANKVELTWTICPILMLMFLAIPSLHTLYLMDELDNPTMTVKAIGHQWYWSYEYGDMNNILYNSFMIPDKLINDGEFRLLEVDNRMIIPMKTKIRLLVTSSDVIHAWTIPSMGIKMDAIPGRINQSAMFSDRPGVYYGQCSEICGMNHSFMPIVMESVNMDSFITWSKNMM